MKKTILVAFVIVLALALVACSGKKEGDASKAAKASKITVKVSHVGPPGCARDVGSHKIGEIMEKKFPGKFEFQVYPSGQLGGQREQIEGMQQGAFEISVNPTAYVGGVVPVITMLGTPFWYPEKYEKLMELFKSPEVKNLFDQTIPFGFYTFNLYHDGYCHYTAKKPLNVPGDVKGLKVRVMASPILMFQAQTLGATPITMAWGETYSALQTGTIDGQDNPITNTYDQKLHEVVKFFTLTYHTTVEEAVYVNKKFFDNLSEEYKKGLLEAIEEGRLAANATTHRLTDEAVKDMKTKGITFIELTPEKRQLWIDATAPVRDFARNNYANVGGDKLFDGITAAIKRISAK